jgi:hypothetical protein
MTFAVKRMMLRAIPGTAGGGEALAYRLRRRLRGLACRHLPRQGLSDRPQPPPARSLRAVPDSRQCLPLTT